MYEELNENMTFAEVEERFGVAGFTHTENALDIVCDDLANKFAKECEQEINELTAELEKELDDILSED